MVEPHADVASHEVAMPVAGGMLVWFAQFPAFDAGGVALHGDFGGLRLGKGVLEAEATGPLVGDELTDTHAALAQRAAGAGGVLADYADAQILLVEERVHRPYVAQLDGAGPVGVGERRRGRLGRERHVERPPQVVLRVSTDEGLDPVSMPRSDALHEHLGVI